MARLLVFRGDMVEQEIEVGVVPVTIGRNDDNDLVLPDPTKGVSRAHAELRYESGQYVIYDLRSQNGVFVDGRRVERAALSPNQPVTIGPYRLVMEQSLDSQEVASPVGGGLTAGDGSQPSGSGEMDDAYAPAGAMPSSVAAPPPAGLAGWVRSHARPLWLGGGAVIVAAAIGLTRMAQSPASPSNADVVAQHLVEARALLDRNEPERAIAEHLDPVLAIDPANGDALDLKSRAQAAVGVVLPPSGGTDSNPTSPPPEAPPIVQGDTRVTSTVSAGSAREKPLNIPPEQGGLMRLPGETNLQLRDREKKMRDSYDEAKRLLGREDYAGAERILTGIVSTAGNRYLDALATLNDARRRRTDAGTRLLSQAADDEANGRWDAASEKYRRAHQIDPSASVDASLQRIAEAKTKAAEATLKTADAYWNLKNDGRALPLYEEAIRLLPPDHPRYAEIRQRIKELQK